jgi:hypothetical protein
MYFDDSDATCDRGPTNICPRTTEGLGFRVDGVVVGGEETTPAVVAMSESNGRTGLGEW